MRIPYPLREQWAITDEGRQLVLDVYHAAHTVPQAERIAAALEARGGEAFPEKPALTIVDGVAEIVVEGPLLRKADILCDVSGATSYAGITACVEECRSDPAIKAVIIRANSPGGEAAGVSACAARIARLAAEKHVEGYVETQAASAMYWLLSQCRHITAQRTAEVGWIGVIKTMTDSSGADEKVGIKRREIVSSGAPEKRSLPMTEDVIAREQRRSDDLEAEFVADVARGRGVSVDKVFADFAAGNGMIAGRALEAGLIDAVGDYEETFAAVAAAAQNPDPIAAQPGGALFGDDSMSKDAKSKPAVDDDDAASTAAAPEDEDKGASNMIDCEHCEGSGEMPDGSKCETCGGTGKVAEAKKAAADDDDDRPKDSDDEAKALAAIGLRPGASRREIMLALAAGAATPMDKVNTLVDERFNALVQKRDRAAAVQAAKSKAEELGATFKSYGADDKQVKAIVDLARINFASAETIVKAHPGAKLTERMTTGGTPIGSKPRSRVENKDSTFNAAFAAEARALVESKDPETLARIAKRAGKNATPGMRLAVAQQIVAEERPELLEEAERG